MTFKRKALGALTRVELLEVGKALELDVTTGMRLDEMMDVVAGSKKRGILEKILALLSRDTLTSICFAVGISAEGREKQVLVDRILAAERGPDNEDDEGEAEQPEPKTKKVRGEEAAKPEPPTPPKPVQVSLPWQGFPVLEPTPPAVTRAARAPALPSWRWWTASRPPTSSAQPRPSTIWRRQPVGLASRRRQKSLAGPRSVTPSTPSTSEPSWPRW